MPEADITPTPSRPSAGPPKKPADFNNLQKNTGPQHGSFDFANVPTYSDRPQADGGFQVKGNNKGNKDRDKYYKNLNQQQQGDDLAKQSKKASLGSRPQAANNSVKQQQKEKHPGPGGSKLPAQDASNKAAKTQQLAKKAQKAGGDAANIAQAAQLLASDGSLKDKAVEGAKIAATEAANVGVEAATGGFVGVKRNQQGQIVVTLGQVFEIKLRYLIAIAIVTNLITWTIAMIVMFATIAAACETVNYQAFGINVGYKAGVALSGVDVEAICGPVSKVVANIIGSGSSTGPITASGCSEKESGGCTRAIINQCPAMAQQMEGALRACNQESAGGQSGIASSTDKCTETTTGKVVSFSWGLWQINIINSTQPEFPECKDVLSEAGGPWGSVCLSGTCGRVCKFGSGGETQFRSCVAAVTDPGRNTRQACTLFDKRGWGPWPHTRRVCGLP